MLVCGRDVRYTAEGRPFFIDHSTRRTQWEPPLPLGWSECHPRRHVAHMHACMCTAARGSRACAVSFTGERVDPRTNRKFFVNHATTYVSVAVCDLSPRSCLDTLRGCFTEQPSGRTLVGCTTSHRLHLEQQQALRQARPVRHPEPPRAAAHTRPLVARTRQRAAHPPAVHTLLAQPRMRVPVDLLQVHSRLRQTHSERGLHTRRLEATLVLAAVDTLETLRTLVRQRRQVLPQ